MAKSPVAKLKAELQKLSPAELQKHRAHVDQAIEKGDSRKREEAMAALEKTAKQYGMSLDELTGGASAPKKSKAGKKRAPAKAKYRNPDDKSQTWSGRGRQPVWYKSRVEAGEDPETMAI